MKRARAVRLLVIGAFALPSVSGGLPASADTAEPHEGVRVMPGGIVTADWIVYEGGAVVVVPSGGDSFDSCPNGWVCLFASTNWQGDMLQLNSCCAWHDLADYGFNNATSSWRNRLSVDAQLAMDPAGGGSRLCLGNGSYASSMPGGWDNAASSIRVRDASTYC